MLRPPCRGSCSTEPSAPAQQNELWLGGTEETLGRWISKGIRLGALKEYGIFVCCNTPSASDSIVTFKLGALGCAQIIPAEGGGLV